jgi:hypothetical protein
MTIRPEIERLQYEGALYSIGGISISMSIRISISSIENDIPSFTWPPPSTFYNSSSEFRIFEKPSIVYGSNFLRRHFGLADLLARQCETKEYFD